MFNFIGSTKEVITLIFSNRKSTPIIKSHQKYAINNLPFNQFNLLPFDTFVRLFVVEVDTSSLARFLDELECMGILSRRKICSVVNTNVLSSIVERTNNGGAFFHFYDT